MSYNLKNIKLQSIAISFERNFTNGELIVFEWYGPLDNFLVNNINSLA